MTTGFAVLLSCCTTAMAGQSGWQDISTGVAVGITVDDNITRAERDFDILDDTILSAEVSASNAFGINDRSYLRLHGVASINRYSDFDGLDNNRIKLNASYFFKPVQGFTAIEYFARIEYELRMFDNSQREGNATRISAGIGKRITDLLSMRLAYVDESIDVEEAMFDTDGYRLYADFSYVLSGTDSLYMTLSRYDGDVLSTSNPVMTNSKLASIPWVIDRAYPRPSASFWWWTYRLDATVNALTLGGAFAIDHHQGIDLSAYYFDTDAEVYNSYSGLIYRLYYSYNF